MKLRYFTTNNERILAGQGVWVLKWMLGGGVKVNQRALSGWVIHITGMTARDSRYY